MSRKFAILKDHTVIEVLTLTEEEAGNKAREVEALIDVEDQIPQPVIGWNMAGNTLVAPSTNLSPEEQDSFQQTAQRLFGLKLLPTAVDKIGARNLKIAREATPADVAALAGQMASIKLLLEGGALKTARTICVAIKPAFPLHSDILQEVADEITAFLSLNGWN